MHIAFNKEFNKTFRQWLKESDPYVLAEADWNQLMEALRNPPKPNENLKKAMKRYKKLKK